MLNVKITNRMTHEDYVSVQADHPYVLSKKHLLGICCTFVVCMVMVLPTPEVWFEENSGQGPVLTQGSRDYLAADESETERALAESEHEVIPHQENYDDYDIPSAQFAQNIDEFDNMLANESDAESDVADENQDKQEVIEYPGVTDTAIANNGDWTWKGSEQATIQKDPSLTQEDESEQQLAANEQQSDASKQDETEKSTQSTAQNNLEQDSATIATTDKTGTLKQDDKLLAEQTDAKDDLGQANSTQDATLAQVDDSHKDSASTSSPSLSESEQDAQHSTIASTDKDSTSPQDSPVLAQTSSSQDSPTASSENAQEQKDKLAATQPDTSASKDVASGDSSAKPVLAKAPVGEWYQYIIEQGDNFSAIFKSLNLPYATLNRITKVAQRKDLALGVNDPVYFLIDKENILLELVHPLDDNEQVRFTRNNGEEDFKVIYEKVNAHIGFDQQLLTSMKDAYLMPNAIKAKQERLERQQAREKAIAERKAYEKANNINPERPRLLIGEVRKGENFTRAAKREGLTPSEVKTMASLVKNKLNLHKLKNGDNFRVLFTGIGTNAAICAISIKSHLGNVELFLNPKDRNFYGENEYTPTAGIFRRFPLAGEIKVTSNFNPARRHPVTRRVSPHNGVDFKASVGTPVYAPADGVVTFSGYQRAAGYYVIVRHANNYSTVYMHLSKSEVKKGDKVIVGQVIARTGNTGRTTGPHLHYEIRIDDRPVNPLKVELPSSSHPNLAREQREAFANNVKLLRAELQNDRLAATNKPNQNTATQ